MGQRDANHERRTKPLVLRLKPSEHAELVRLASTEGLSVSAFVRKWTLAAKGAAQEGVAKKYGGFEDSVSASGWAPSPAEVQAELERKGQMRIGPVDDAKGIA